MGVHLIPESAYKEAAWRGDDFLKRLTEATNAFSDHAPPLARALRDLAELAGFILNAARNKAPDVRARTFAVAIRRDYTLLTGALAWRGDGLLAYLHEARSTARLPEMSSEKLLRNLSDLDNEIT